MSRSFKRELPPPQASLEKLEKMVNEGSYYEAQQIYKSTSARYASMQRYSEALDILESGALLQLNHQEVTCGAELATLFVETLIKGKFPYDNETLGRVRRIFEAFPRISLPLDLLGEDDDMQKLSEAMVAAKARVEGCCTFLRTALKWSAEFGASKNGSPEFHEMLADYMYSETPETDMMKVSSHFVRGNDPKKFAKTLVNFMSKCYPEEDDVAIARGVLMYLSQGNLRDANILMDEIKHLLELDELDLPQSELMQFIEYLLLTLERDAYPLMKVLRQNFKSSIERDPLFDESLDEIAERFYNVKRRSGGIQGLLGDLFKMPMM
ncbi:Golgi to ER traffic protein 4 [Rhynchospora pubera]|uniref:Golgi to ER traffic protein 4 n=1 Tax=Rhynchospora pubera TaxID=906938 RepID=A0AAV8FCG9_9POAL|nr:Golgi to ER traffic protein 4 [Rhynchospora pubera]